jgi:hypothetical protein
MIELGSLCGEADFDLPQALAIGKLGERPW